MPSLIPNQFGRRERRLTAVAVLSGLVIACVACLTGFGTYGGWILLAIIGMFVFLAVGRQQRAYFAGVFGVTLFVLWRALWQFPFFSFITRRSTRTTLL